MKVQTTMSNSRSSKSNRLMAHQEARWKYAQAGLRHSHLLMRPISFFLLLLVGLYWLLSTILSLPSALLAFALGPVLRRAFLFIEFLYPLSVVRTAHMLIIQFAQRSWKKKKITGDKKEGKKKKKKNGNMHDDDNYYNVDKNRGFHSRTIEQRVEVVTGRVYIHPLAQLLDNIGYLVVCCPESISHYQSTVHTSLGKVQLTKTSNATPSSHQLPIVAFVVDCGDAEEVMEQVHMISKVHYNNHPIQIQAILSTHKHHDHTAGNAELIRLNQKHTIQSKVNITKADIATKTQKNNAQNKTKNKSTIKFVFGGAVEKIPCCNVKLADGDRLDLPRYASNKMSDLIQVEAIVLPAHTRGSIVYALRTKHDVSTATTSLPVVFMFTGDTLFSGGGGVPFEAGTDPQQDKMIYNNTSKHSKINTELGNHAIERNFAEILSRGLPTMSDTTTEPYTDQFILFPGHEYTAELLGRQLQKESMDLHRWHNLPPSAFFETVSNLYVSLHRRSLPYGSGRLLAVPSTMQREININPHMRNLARRGEFVIAALKLWNEFFSSAATSSKDKPGPRNSTHYQHQRIESGNYQLDDSLSSDGPMLTQASSIKTSPKTPATPSSWNVGAADINHDVFTTVYTNDLERIIDQLDSGIIGPQFAASKLRAMKARLEMPTIRRRPIPGTLPSQKNMYKGLIGLALMGSRPSALTLGDSEKLNLPPPVISNSDHVLISKTRLVTVLAQLGLLSEVSQAHSNNGNQLIQIINQLWKESYEYRYHQIKFPVSKKQTKTVQNYDSVDLESPSAAQNFRYKGEDLIELGILKWMLYGLASKTKQYLYSSSTSTFCMPCSSTSTTSSSTSETGFSEVHPSQTQKIRQQHGELVRHDILQCEICRNFVGFCDHRVEEEEEEEDEDEEEDGVEISVGLNHLSLHEANNDQYEADDSGQVGLEMSYNESILPVPVPASNDDNEHNS